MTIQAVNFLLVRRANKKLVALLSKRDDIEKGGGESSSTSMCYVLKDIVVTMDLDTFQTIRDAFLMM